ncbi:MAG: hypothetical protein OCD76_12055 [Reichenbachiella sp.]
MLISLMLIGCDNCGSDGSPLEDYSKSHSKSFLITNESLNIKIKHSPKYNDNYIKSVLDSNIAVNIDTSKSLGDTLILVFDLVIASYSEDYVDSSHINEDFNLLSTSSNSIEIHFDFYGGEYESDENIRILAKNCACSIPDMSGYIVKGITAHYDKKKNFKFLTDSGN